MSTSINQRLIAQITSIKSSSAFLVYLVVAFLIRLPFFFRDYIDRDESTFILLAQSIVDGNLPYTELWDLKPPMIFYTLALVIAVFGKSFLAIRLAGTFIVALIAQFTFLIGKRIHSTTLGFWCGLLAVYLSSLFGSVQGVMTEHLSMAFFLPAIWLILRSYSWKKYLLSGTLFGLALMTKLNLAYAVVLAGAFVLFIPREIPWRQRFTRFSWLISGTLLILFLNILPFLVMGDTALFINSVFIAPLAYANAENGSIVKIMPFLGIIVLFFALALWKSPLDLKNRHHLFIVLMIAGIVFSFVRVGKINGHYLLQFYPLFLIALAIALLPLFRRARNGILIPVIVILFLLPVESYKEYAFVASEYHERSKLYNGEGNLVADYLGAQNLGSGDIVFFEYHIGYWLLGVKPPSKAATHPSNICRDFLFPYFDNPRDTSIEELEYIIKELKPLWVVVREGRPVFDFRKAEENLLVSQLLETDYRVDKTIEEAIIYRRLQGH